MKRRRYLSFQRSSKFPFIVYAIGFRSYVARQDVCQERESRSLQFPRSSPLQSLFTLLILKWFTPLVQFSDEHYNIGYKKKCFVLKYQIKHCIDKQLVRTALTFINATKEIRRQMENPSTAWLLLFFWKTIFFNEIHSLYKKKRGIFINLYQFKLIKKEKLTRSATA